MNKSTFFSLVVSLVLLFVACGGGSEPATPAESRSAAPPVASEHFAPRAETAKAAGMRKISDMSDAWSELYNQNEAAVNAYEGMPIMDLVTPPTTFIATVQFDIMNPENRDEVIYIHNGPGRPDFVVAKAKSGPGFKSISFKEAGDLTKAQALDLFKASGYAIDATDGIKDGTLFVEK